MSLDWLLGPHQPPPQPPDGWGEDHLSRYLDNAYNNRFATFFKKRGEYNLLSEIDHTFLNFTINWQADKDHILPSFFLRSHAAFLTSTEHLLGAQLGECYVGFRLSLEYAGYSILIRQNHDLAQTWLRRQDSDKHRQAVRQSFTHGAIRKSIKSIDPSLEIRFSELYERTIDWGAHPNELAVTSATTKLEHEDRIHILQQYLYGDGIQFDHALGTGQAVGLCCLNLFSHVFPERYAALNLASHLSSLEIAARRLAAARMAAHQGT